MRAAADREFPASATVVARAVALVVAVLVAWHGRVVPFGICRHRRVNLDRGRIDHSGPGLPQFPAFIRMSAPI